MKINVSFLKRILTKEKLMKFSDSIVLESFRDKEVEFVPFSAMNMDYAIDHFLDESDEMGYGYECTNKIVSNDRLVIFGLVEGDDALCFERPSGDVVLWLIQSEGGKIIPLASSLADFLNMSIAVIE